MLSINDEIRFFYKDTIYQVNYGITAVTAMYIFEYNRNQKLSERSENFSSVIELLEKF